MYGGLTLMFVSKQFRLTSKLWCVPLWSSYVKRWAMTAPSMWQISSCVSFVSCKVLCNAWFQTQATNEFYRNVINNNKITPSKQASIIGSKEWHDEKWSSVLQYFLNMNIYMYSKAPLTVTKLCLEQSLTFKQAIKEWEKLFLTKSYIRRSDWYKSVSLRIGDFLTKGSVWLLYAALWTVWKSHYVVICPR